MITHPEHARGLLVAHPQLGYALFQALLLNKIVDPTILKVSMVSLYAPGLMLINTGYSACSLQRRPRPHPQPQQHKTHLFHNIPSLLHQSTIHNRLTAPILFLRHIYPTNLLEPHPTRCTPRLQTPRTTCRHQHSSRLTMPDHRHSLRHRRPFRLPSLSRRSNLRILLVTMLHRG